MGCSQEEKLVLSKATLKGKITYKGQPVPHALVIVSGATSATGNADADGNYSVANAPVGEVNIGVNTDAGRGNMMSAMMSSSQGGDTAAKPKFVDVPKKFFDPTSSGIATTVANSEGENEFDIDIK